MSYLLGYQKWRKLHESAKYGRLNEQEFNSATPVDFILLGGTSPTAIYDAGLAANGMKTTGKEQEVKLYEISILDALQGNFQNFVEIKSLDSNNIKDRDRVQVMSGQNIVAEIAGEGIITFTYSPKLNDVKLRVSGNGALSLHRAAIELKNNDSIDLTKHSGNIRLYVSQEKSPIANSPRFSKVATSVGKGLDALTAKTTTLCIYPALHYMVEGEDNKKYVEQIAPESFKDPKAYNPSQGINDNPIFLGTTSGAFYGTQNKYTGLDSFKNLKPNDFWQDPSALPQSRFLKAEILDALNTYAKACLDNFTKEGGTIDQYFKQNFGQLPEDLLTSLVLGARGKAEKAKEKALGSLTANTNAKIAIARMPAQASAVRPTGVTKVEKQSGEYEEGDINKK